jgi:predicted aldo/keto reductase-like oxidoreductase
MGLNALAEDKRPSECENCGACKNHCPQNLSIPEFMKEMAAGMSKLKAFTGNLKA